MSQASFERKIIAAFVAAAVVLAAVGVLASHSMRRLVEASDGKRTVVKVDEAYV